MALKPLILIYFFCSISLPTFSQQQWNHFTFNGFQKSNLHLDGGANIHPNGLLQLTNTSKQLTSHAFYPIPLKFGSNFSFSTTFVFAMYPEIPVISGHGIVFVISPSLDFRGGVPGKYFGLFNATSNDLSSNHIFAVELDTIQDLEFKDIDSNHVGIDVNGLISNASSSAGYFSDSEGKNKSLDLLSAKPMQIWVDYDDNSKLVNVAMAPLGVPRPSQVLVSSRLNLSEILFESMYVGFSSSTGSVASSHYVLGWSFSHGGSAQKLDLSNLPALPRVKRKGKKLGLGSMILVIIISSTVVILMLVFFIMRRKKYEEVLEDWEQEYLLQRFSYKNLYKATKGFKDREVLGSGGFGKVYRGVLASTKAEVAVKRVSHGSGQGMREFVAEIACLGRLRHRNLVQLLGYCRTKGELLLVYDYMPNGSLDMYLYQHYEKPNLSWVQRFKILKNIASALLYLHEEWEQVVVHRDIKASNVLLDSDLNARLGDFGLARLYDHGSNPQTTHVVGTVGYLAPELTRRGKASTNTDVFSFGILMLEVTCGRSPISLQGDSEEKYLVDWVCEFWKNGRIVDASDLRLREEFVAEEVELVLKVGLLCAHPNPEARPSMRQVVQFLEGDCVFPSDDEIRMFSSVDQNSQARSSSFQTSTSGRASALSSYSNDSILRIGR